MWLPHGRKVGLAQYGYLFRALLSGVGGGGGLVSAVGRYIYKYRYGKGA